MERARAGLHGPPVGPRFHINSGPGPSWSEIFWKYLVLVRVGPWFSENIWSRSEFVHDFLKIFGPGPSRSLISQFFSVLVQSGPRTEPNRSVRNQSVSVRGSLVWTSVCEFVDTRNYCFFVGRDQSKQSKVVLTKSVFDFSILKYHIS